MIESTSVSPQPGLPTSFDLRRLRYFIAVAEELHFGRAARRLHMTQPPLSQQIRLLEGELGVELFARTQRSVALTEAGLWLLPEARRLLEQADDLRAGVQRAACGESGALTLAFVTIADYALLPDLLREFRARAPGIVLTLRESTSDLQFEDLARRRIDAGLLIPPLPDNLRDELDYLPLLHDPLIAALPARVARVLAPGPDDRVDIGALSRYPLVIFPRRLAPAFHDMILGVFQRAGHAPRVVQEAIQMQTIVSLVSGDLGVALVPKSIAKLQRPEVAYRELDVAAPEVEVGLAWRKDNDSAALRALVAWLSAPGRA